MTSQAERPTVPDKAAGTSRENPWPVRALSQRMAEHIARAPAAWIEGQIAQANIRPNNSIAYLTLRDASADMSLQVTCFKTVIAGLTQPPEEGDRVVVFGKFEYYTARGSLSFRVSEIHPVGLGELLARLQRVRALLAAEGLALPSRKKQLPFLPQVVGLITGRASAAESDVLVNARARWPAVIFRVENPTVQGASAVPQIIACLRKLDADPDVEVIILARGGGSVEDLLPFSDETLCREVASCKTPVVSAIGHEPDHPIVDDVADVRCSTPTDAGKRVVPDAVAEFRQIEQFRLRARRSLTGWVSTETAKLNGLRSRAVLADPHGPINARTDQVERFTVRARSLVSRTIEREQSVLEQRLSQLSALGPAATLRRGYAVVQVAGHVLRDTSQAPAGSALRVRVADGAVLAISSGPEMPTTPSGTKDSDSRNTSATSD
ncbi:exodeoxyribonuclease VII large subunit [Nakamurella antarctica]|uniref:Exodeoxyribonuclease 7 large subunit n=1 Tax=Nakamurella antarctica TaxID=1902245 RepID=A0A3G8ZKT9_9ACTN|nr:exodeoxyribonuclease VII large subunit [Nakamurella antarctica]AZI57397.1 exodeoxyribonuclease VII large subunit [Nakamurella antarctica]